MSYSEYDKIVLPLTLLAIILAVSLVAVVLRNKSESIRSIPTKAVTVFMLFIEIIKQRWNLLGKFDAFYLPFHYCSLFIFVFILAELCGKRLSRIFRPIAICMSFIVSAAMYVYPHGIMGDATESFGKVFKNTHGFIFHHLIVLYMILVIALRLSTPGFKDALHVGILGTVYMSFAIPLSYILNTNYNNILTSVIPLMENIRNNYGQAVYIVLLTLFMTIGTFLGSLIYIAIQKIALCTIGLKND